MSRKLGNRVFLITVMFAGVICLGCNRRNDTKKPDSSELQPTSDRVDGQSPATRALALSEPAPDRRQWTIQALKAGYQHTGRTNSAWDAKVESAFEAFANYSRGSTTNWPALEKALAALATTACNDPMIQYMRVRYGNQPQSEEATASQFSQVHDAMRASEYHPVFKFFAGMRAVQSARAANIKTNAGPRIQRTMSDLEALARDTNAPIDEVFEPAFMWLGHSRSKEWIEYVTRNLNRSLEQNWGRTDQWFRFQGDAEVWRAWGERGSGWATGVTEKGWEGFAEHLDKAEQFLVKAWQLNSNNAYTAYLMMQVELGQGKGRSRMESWFNRAMSVETNYFDAVKLMSFYLEPRWYGSQNDALAFARVCVSSDKWGGQVPLVLANVHHSLANYMRLSNSPAYWRKPQVWRDVKSSYEKFFTLNPEADAWRHDYAKDAYFCGQYPMFLEQTKLFAHGTNYVFFGGKDEFEKMLATAKAASRPAEK